MDHWDTTSQSLLVLINVVVLRVNFCFSQLCPPWAAAAVSRGLVRPVLIASPAVQHHKVFPRHLLMSQESTISTPLSGACDDQLGSDALQRPAAGTSLNRFFCFFLFVNCSCCTMRCDCRARERAGTEGLLFPGWQNISLLEWFILGVEQVCPGPCGILLHCFNPVPSVYLFNFYSGGLNTLQILLAIFCRCFILSHQWKAVTL